MRIKQSLMSIIILFSFTTLLPVAGNLDSSFDSNGIVITGISGIDEAHDIAIQQDEKIVVVGRVDIGGVRNIGVVRYNENGSLDATFGTGGIVNTNLGGTEDAFGVAIQPDNKIVVVGAKDGDFVIVRYNANGTLDTAGFNSGATGGDAAGTRTVNFGLTDQANAVALQPVDGKIVVVGHSGSAKFAITRINTDGSLDNVTFNPLGTNGDASGKRTIDFTGGIERANDVLVTPGLSGKIIVVGGTNFGASGDFAVAQLDLAGNLDPSFDTDGKVVTNILGGDEALSVARQPDGKIVVSGCANTAVSSDFAVVRYNTDGSLDTAFDTDGKVTTDISGSADIGYGVAVQPDGKIVVAGQSGTPNFAVVRYNSDGSLDVGFNPGGLFGATPNIAGIVTTNVGGTEDVRAVALDPDGRILVAGFNGSDFAVARYSGITPGPNAIDDCFYVCKDSTDNLLYVLSNDLIGQCGTTLTIIAKTDPTNGTVTISGSGTFLLYTPTGSFTGFDSFTYIIEDDNGNQDTATVVVKVSSVCSPTAVDDMYTVCTNSQNNCLDILCNDIRGSDPIIEINTISTPDEGGTVTKFTNASGLEFIKYTPVPGFSGTETFNYTVKGLPSCTVSLPACVVIEVSPAAGPHAICDKFFVEDYPPVVNNLDVLADDILGCNPPITIISVTTPDQGGSVVISGGGTSLDYTPSGVFTGIETFQYTIEDSSSPTPKTSTTTVVVCVGNLPPVLVDDEGNTTLTNPVAIDLDANDMDADGTVDPATVTVTKEPPLTTCVVNPATGVITITPDPNVFGTFCGEYIAADNEGLFALAPAKITIKVSSGDAVCDAIGEHLGIPNVAP